MTVAVSSLHCNINFLIKIFLPNNYRHADVIVTCKVGGNSMAVSKPKLSGLIGDSYHGLQKLLRALEKLVEYRKETIKALNEIAKQLDKAHKDANIAKMTGSTVGIVGGATAIVGVALIPVTMGVSTILVGVGKGVSAIGGLVGGGASIMESVHGIDKNSKAQKLIKHDKEQCEMVGSLLKKYDKLCKDIVHIIEKDAPPDPIDEKIYSILKKVWEAVKSIPRVDPVISMVQLLKSVAVAVNNA